MTPALRAQLHSEGVTYLEAKRHKRGAGVPTLLLIRDAQKAARAQAPLAPGTMEFDPRMFFPHSTRGLLNQKGGLTVYWTSLHYSIAWRPRCG